jgi:hypothetical protein
MFPGELFLRFRTIPLRLRFAGHDLSMPSSDSLRQITGGKERLRRPVSSPGRV